MPRGPSGVCPVRMWASEASRREAPFRTAIQNRHSEPPFRTTIQNPIYCCMTQGVHWRLHDRREAGAVLAARLAEYTGRPDAIVLALPRGGVPVGQVIAEELKLPLDVFLVRKLGVPLQPEFAFGAIAEGGIRVLNRDVIAAVGLTRERVDQISA